MKSPICIFGRKVTSGAPVLAILLAVLAGCAGGQCGARVMGVRDFAGDMLNPEPHSKAWKTKGNIPMGCVGDICTYQVSVKVLAHNPTAVDKVADIRCTFFDGDYQNWPIKYIGLKVPAGKTNGVELYDQLNLTAGVVASVGVICEVYWK